MGLRKQLDALHPLFAKGGKFHKYYAVYEMVDTFVYSPPDVAKVAPHVRDHIDLKRVMIFVWLATFPVIFMACLNTGFQANSAIASLNLAQVDGWQAAMAGAFAGFDPANAWHNFFHGLMYFLPIYFITFLVGGIWEAVFAIVRGHEVNEGFFVTSILFALTMPPDAPLWQVALGISFGVVVGKEVFGGTGKNFLNPALTGRAFLFFAYPAEMSGDAVWVAVDGFTAASPLGVAALGGVGCITAASVSEACSVVANVSWTDAFLGFIPGSLGETSTLAILLGGLFLIATKIASWRIIAGVFLGMVATALLLNLVGSETNPMFAMGPEWHFVIGGFAFGMIFMATDPVSASMTNKGRFIFGFMIGFMVVIIRVVNPAFPEGMMLAILFANIFAPLIDHFVVQSNIRRREKRTAVATAE